MDIEKLKRPFERPKDLKIQRLPLSAVQFKSFNEKDLTYESFISAQITDRDGEGVVIDGIDLTQYLDTPVVGFVHFYDDQRGYLPIGGTLELRKEIHPKYKVQGLVAKVQLLDEKTEFMQTIIKCLQFPINPLLAESIGFISKSWAEVMPTIPDALWNDARRWCLTSTLLEHSLCPVVSNYAATPKAEIDKYFNLHEREVLGIDKYLIQTKCQCLKTMVIFDREVGETESDVKIDNLKQEVIKLMPEDKTDGKGIIIENICKSLDDLKMAHQKPSQNQEKTFLSSMAEKIK